MRLVAILLASALLALPGIAATSDPAGATLETDRQIYSYVDADGPQTVDITIRNEGLATLYFPQPYSFTIFRGSHAVFSPGSIQAIEALAPGEHRSFLWDFRTNCFGNAVQEPACVALATPGEYEVRWTYSTSPEGPWTYVSTSFTLRLG